jgi:hypothetical protein
MHVRRKLPHRFFADGDILGNFAAITFQVDRINQQDMAWRDFVGGKGKSSWWNECTIRFPHFDPGTERREPARNCDLLTDILKDDWGFDGFVESDWLLGTRSTVRDVSIDSRGWVRLYDGWIAPA